MVTWCVFFFKQKTAYEMRISDWSSDVCSSDLLHIRLSRQKREGSAVLLKIDDRTWQLIGGGNNAWAPDRRADAEIVAAMRTGVDMTIETRSDRGARVQDHYRWSGAATDIADAAIACARPRQQKAQFIPKNGKPARRGRR